MKHPYTERIQNLSGLFPLSSVLGLMPCAEDDSVNRRLTIYTVFMHAVYRILNITVLVYFLMLTKTSVSLLALLAVVTVMKFLCATVQVVVVMKNRHRFLKLVEHCGKSHFTRNTYRNVTKFGLGYCLYLYVAGQAIQRRWEAAFRDIFSSLDVVVPFLTVMQFCTFLQISTDRFKTSRLHLLVYFYKTDDIVEQHLQDLEDVLILQDLYTYQMFFCVCYLGFDFFVASYDTLERVLTAKNLVWTLCTTSYCTLCITTILILARACEETKQKAEKFDQQLFLLLNENQSLRQNPKLQLYLKRKMPINFTGSHFFNLGYPLVTSIIAATTTYLIFLIQFSSNEE